MKWHESRNGFVPNKWQAITQTNVELSSIGPLGINSREILIKILKINQGNAFENVVYKMAVISFRHKYVYFLYLPPGTL